MVWKQPWKTRVLSSDLEIQYVRLSVVGGGVLGGRLGCYITNRQFQFRLKGESERVERQQEVALPLDRRCGAQASLWPMTAIFGCHSFSTCGKKSRWNFGTGQVSSKLKSLKDRSSKFIFQRSK